MEGAGACLEAGAFLVAGQMVPGLVRATDRSFDYFLDRGTPGAGVLLPGFGTGAVSDEDGVPRGKADCAACRHVAPLTPETLRPELRHEGPRPKRSTSVPRAQKEGASGGLDQVAGQVSERRSGSGEEQRRVGGTPRRRSPLAHGLARSSPSRFHPTRQRSTKCPARLTALGSPALRVSHWRLECRNEQCNLTFPRTGVAEGAK